MRPIENGPKQLQNYKPKGPTVPAAAAEATGLPEESFTTTSESGLKNSMMRGKIAKKLGAKTTEVDVRTDGVTFTGKALEKLQQTGRKMAADVAGDLTGPPGWTESGWKQVYVTGYDSPEDGSRKHMTHESPIVSVPDRKSNLVTELGYLVSKGPGR